MEFGFNWTTRGIVDAADSKAVVPCQNKIILKNFSVSF